jgi:hypothetical protein
MNKFAIPFCLLCVSLVTGGCAAPRQDKTVDKICVTSVGNAQAVLAAEDVLADMHFIIEKSDARQGFVSTKPLQGAQFFEFWRSDNVGPYNSLEANLQSLRRTARLSMSKTGNRLCIACNVNVQRLSIPQQQVGSSARAYQMFSESTVSVRMLSLQPGQKQQMAWIDLGTDDGLAAVILNRVEKRLMAAGSQGQKSPGMDIQK